MKAIKQHIAQLHSKDKNIQGASYQTLMGLTEKVIEIDDEIWNSLLDLLKNGNNTGRSIAAQILCNLAKSDTKNRISRDLPNLFEATKDEKFVTARHSLLALWKVGIVTDNLQKKVLDGLSKRFKESVTEKNCTLIRYDIGCVFRKIFDTLPKETIYLNSLSLIQTEQNEKAKKKYLTVWKDIIKIRTTNR